MSKVTTQQGTVYVIDIDTKKVLYKGQGSYDTESKKLGIKYTTNKYSKDLKVVYVFDNGSYFMCPGYRIINTILGATQEETISVTDYYAWSNKQSKTYILNQFKKFEIKIESLVDEVSWSTTAPEMQITALQDRGIQYSSKGFNTEIKPTHQIQLPARRYKPTVESWMLVQTSVSKPKVNFLDSNSIIKSFTLYWRMQHKQQGCRITQLVYDGNLTLNLADKYLDPLRKNEVGYSELPGKEHEFSLKLYHATLEFYLNFAKDKDKGASSKVGLAFDRTLWFADKNDKPRFEHSVTDLIFALQSFCESVTTNDKIKNIDTPVETIGAEVGIVLESLKSLTAEMSDTVRDFYMKDENTVIQLITKPTFMESVDATLKLYGINTDKYKAISQVLDSSRRKIVHSQGYDIDYLIDNLLTKGTMEINEGEDGTSMTVVFGIKIGALESLYNLLIEMYASYLNSEE